MSTATLFSIAIFLLVTKLLFWVINVLTKQSNKSSNKINGVAYKGPIYNRHGRVVNND